LAANLLGQKRKEKKETSLTGGKRKEAYRTLLLSPEEMEERKGRTCWGIAPKKRKKRSTSNPLKKRKGVAPSRLAGFKKRGA